LDPAQGVKGKKMSDFEKALFHPKIKEILASAFQDKSEIPINQQTSLEGLRWLKKIGFDRVRSALSENLPYDQTMVLLTAYSLYPGKTRELEINADDLIEELQFCLHKGIGRMVMFMHYDRRGFFDLLDKMEKVNQLF